ncbi:hypothetical protein [Magnetospirillum gryphiswaldense]|nr:hypothetical protein [Magnetospirillum gryphiswaldense]
MAKGRSFGFGGWVFLLMALGAATALALVVAQGGRLMATPKLGLVFVVLPAGVLVFALICLRLPTAMRLSAAITCLSIGCSLWAFEVWLLAQKGRQGVDELVVRAKAAQVAYDARSKSEVVSDLRKAGQDAFPAVFPSLFLIPQGAKGVVRSPLNLDGGEILPLGGVPESRAVVCNEAGQWLVQDTDRNGFPNPSDVAALTSVDIALLGDSFTQGMCVPTSTSFADRIRQVHPATLNLGNGGNGPLLALATLIEYARPLAPRRVLWFFFEGNDLADLNVESRSPLLRGYLVGSTAQNLTARAGHLAPLLRDYAEKSVAASQTAYAAGSALPLSQQIFRFVSLTETRIGLGLTATSIASPDFALFGQVLTVARDQVSGWGGRLTIVYLPAWESTIQNPQAGLSEYQRVATIIKDLGIDFVDLRAEIARHPDPIGLFPLRQAGHYAEAGHSWVADNVLTHLRERP